MKLKETELHVHVLQSLYPEDLFFLAKDVYREINWNRFGFLDRYEKIFKVRLDPVAIFDRAIKTNSLTEIEEINYYRFKGKGNFDEFDIKSFFPLCITGYYFDRNNPYPVLERIVKRHQEEGIKYIEYRNGFGGSGEEWKKWHADFARFFKHSSTESFTAKYIARLGSYKELKEMLEENPDIKDTVVGVDFSGREIDPDSIKSLYEEIISDDILDIVVHIGENFLDKSLESAIRWCHLAALNGAKRLAHCIALGIDPEIAIKRNPNGHEEETVAERLKQIRYDLEFQTQLSAYHCFIDIKQLKAEEAQLKLMDPLQLVKKPYDQRRLDEVKFRQNFVLDELARLKTVIEVCPTSNLCIGGVPSIKDHHFKRLYDSNVSLVICSDDPGIFGSSLSDEVDFVIKNFQISPEDLNKRLDNPYLYRLRGERK